MSDLVKAQRLQRCISKTVPNDKAGPGRKGEGGVTDAERVGYVELCALTCTEHYGEGFPLSWLRTSFPCFHSHQSLDSKNTGRCTEQQCSLSHLFEKGFYAKDR